MPDVKMNLTTELPLQIKVYAIKPDKKGDFLPFCDSDIKAWLDDWGVANCSAWTVEDANGLSLVVAATPHDDHPWEKIPHIKDFLKEGPLQVITEVGSLKIP